VHILSIQSWVAYGQVGNASAVFPLQRLGADVSAINTVVFSNHPGYGAHTGDITPPASIRALLEGIEALGVLANCDALLSGYLGHPETGPVVLEAAERLRQANPGALWCCDPVIGDEDPGIYVRPGIAEFFRDRAVAQADLLTPNHFELKFLAGSPCTTLAQTRTAVAALQARMPASGPRTVLVTSVRTEDTPENCIDCFAAMGEGFFRLRTPLLPIAVNGAGDTMAALFLFHMLARGDARLALEMAASSIHGVLTRTWESGARELRLVAAQGEFVRPSIRFSAESC
jgi:pyridoxine kinase